MGGVKVVSNEEIIAALIVSRTTAEAAEKVGISRQTLFNRMTDNDFREEYAEAKNDILRQVVLQFNSMITEAIDTLADIMEDKSVNAAVRLQAAQFLINNACKFADRLDAGEGRRQGIHSCNEAEKREQTERKEIMRFDSI